MRHDIEENIEEAFLSYLTNLFSLTAPSKKDIDEVTKVIKPKFREEMNSQLNRRYTNEEVEATLNQIAPLKSLGL